MDTGSPLAHLISPFSRAIFKGRVWYPRTGGEDPVYDYGMDYLARIQHNERWRGGMPL